MATIKNDETIAELSRRFKVHPTMINNRKKVLLNGAVDIFDKGHKFPKQTETKFINYTLKLAS